MRRPFRWDKKYLYWGITAFCVIACAILFYMALSYLPLIGSGIAALVRIFTPFIWGLVISYLLAPMMKRFDSGVFSPLLKKLHKKGGKKKGSKLSRGLAVLCSELVLLIIIAALVYLILPQLYSSIETIISNSNTYITTASTWAENTLKNYPEIEEYVVGTIGNLNSGIISWLRDSVLPQLGSMVTNVTSGVVVVVKAIYNLIIGIIVSVYVLSNLERFLCAVRKLGYCIFTQEAMGLIRRAVVFTDKTFIGFINGKLFDSAIIGLLCYIFCAIVKMPYALLVSVIVGVTNIIPFFGPFIGAIPTALIILLVNPFKCLVFIIFIVILQQVDGNLIGPKILGSSIGINGFWVMFSIIVGAGLFGFWGMLLGVPVFVVIYTAINRLVDRKLRRSGLPTEDEAYRDADNCPAGSADAPDVQK